MDPEVVESASPEVQEPVDVKVPEVSGPAEGQPTSVPSGLTEEALQKILDDRFTKLAEDLKRDNQSMKDRRIGKLETSVEKLLAVKGLVDQKGGDWEAAISETRESEISERMANLESKLLQPPVAVSPDWKQEWQDESKKIVDAAAKLGIALTDDEYNAALFGKKFASKGDAFAALQGALILKTRGESVTPAALANEGGTLPAQPEKLDFRQTLAKAETTADKTKVLEAQWDVIGKELKKREVRDALVEKGLTVEDLR